MSYNCDTFKTKIIKDLVIPVSSLFKHERNDWHPKRIDNDDGTVTFTNLDTEIIGRIIGENLHVIEIDCSGEGSGTVMDWILEPALKESTGVFVASCAWEGGDCINKITVVNGISTWENIDI